MAKRPAAGGRKMLEIIFQEVEKVRRPRPLTGWLASLESTTGALARLPYRD